MSDTISDPVVTAVRLHFNDVGSIHVNIVITCLGVATTKL